MHTTYAMDTCIETNEDRAFGLEAYSRYIPGICKGLECVRHIPQADIFLTDYSRWIPDDSWRVMLLRIPDDIHCLMWPKCKICKIICTICTICNHDFNMSNMHSPLCWYSMFSLRYTEYLLRSIRSEVSFHSGMHRAFKQSYRLCERRFVRTINLQKGFSLLEAVNDGSGKEMVWVPKI